MKSKYKIFVLSVAALGTCQVAVVLLSWVASVLFPSSSINSLLGSSGLRWLLSSYERNVNTSFFFYFLMACFCLGMFIQSGLPKKIISLRACNYNERLGITIFFASLAIAIVLSLIFAFYPHSLLLSIDGTIYPGPYPEAILFIFTVAVTLGTCLYIILSGPQDPYASIAKALTAGLQAIIPIMIIYFLLVELILSILYVIGGQQL